MSGSFKKLSESASQGEWAVFDDGAGTLEIGHAERLGERPCIVGWQGFDSTDKPMQERRANARFIVTLVNAFRAGELVQAGASRPAIGPRWEGVMLDLIGLAEAAMRGANRDGGEYEIEEELRPARELVSATENGAKRVEK